MDIKDAVTTIHEIFQQLQAANEGYRADIKEAMSKVTTKESRIKMLKTMMSKRMNEILYEEFVDDDPDDYDSEFHKDVYFDEDDMLVTIKDVEFEFHMVPLNLLAKFSLDEMYDIEPPTSKQKKREEEKINTTAWNQKSVIMMSTR